MTEKEKTPTVFFVLGGPGSGKGTNCARLAHDFGYTHLSAGELLRAAAKSGQSETARLIAERINAGLIVPSEITVRLLKETIAETQNPRGYVIDGFPRKADQARMFEESIAKAKAIIYLECSEPVMEARLLGRAAAERAGAGGAGGANARSDDSLEVIRHRFRVNVEECMPVVQAYEKEGRCYVVNSDQDVDQVYKDVRSLFLRLGEQPL